MSPIIDIPDDRHDRTSPVHLCRYGKALPDPVQTLERYFTEGGISLEHAVFENSFFVDPAVARKRTPYFPGHARYSREHYGKLGKGEQAVWQGTPVRLDDNSRAQMAWERYTGRRLSRGTGFGLRHVWGHPWDPAAFTAGWNLAYMPHWAGMLTESQHSHALIQKAVRQASWDLFFRENPVCATPAFVSDPGIDLEELLEADLSYCSSRSAMAFAPTARSRRSSVRSGLRAISHGRTSVRPSPRCKAEPMSPSAPPTSRPRRRAPSAKCAARPASISTHCPASPSE